jgi:lysozyme
VIKWPKQRVLPQQLGQTFLKEVTMKFIEAGAIVALLVGSTITVRAEEPLENDLSRAQLFNIMIDRLVDSAPAAEKNLYRPGAFLFPHDAIWDDPTREVNARRNALFGIDVSHHNENDCRCKLDWSAIQAQKISFAYVKATQGATYYDKRFDEHWTDIKALPAGKKVYLGAYHFLSSDRSAEDQANNFIKAVVKKMDSEDLPPSLDLEWDVRVGADGRIILGEDGKQRDFWANVPPQEIIEKTLKWLELTETATGKVPIVYTNRAWWNERIKDERRFDALKKYPIWIADYSKSGRANEVPSVPNKAKWVLWQFTAAAKFSSGGLPTLVDANVFKGTEAEFRMALGLARK